MARLSFCIWLLPAIILSCERPSGACVIASAPQFLVDSGASGNDSLLGKSPGPEVSVASLFRGSREGACGSVGGITLQVSLANADQFRDFGLRVQFSGTLPEKLESVSYPLALDHLGRATINWIDDLSPIEASMLVQVVDRKGRVVFEAERLLEDYVRPPRLPWALWLVSLATLILAVLCGLAWRRSEYWRRIATSTKNP